MTYVVATCEGTQFKRQRGMSLIEAMVAMLIVSFGMMAVVGMQVTFGRNSEEAKIRGEAVRLAQLKMDQLRAFEQRMDEAGKFSYCGKVVSSTTATDADVDKRPITESLSNTTYTITWVVSPAETAADCSTPPATSSTPTPMHRTVRVNVAWTDRTGASRTFVMDGVLAKLEPADLGTLAYGPGSTSVRRPKNRDINIPYPAVTLSGGDKSAFRPAGSSTPIIVFDNLNGDVVGVCAAGSTSLAEGMNLDLTGCNQNRAYLVSGYIRFCLSNGCGASNQPGDAGAKYANAADATLALNSSVPVAFLDDGGNPVTALTPSCYSARQVTLKSNGTTVSDTGQPDNQVSARFIAYVCVVYPLDDDSNPSTRSVWTAKAVLRPDAWTVGSGSSNYRVCRFSADYDRNNALNNNEHPSKYRAVSKSIDSQNYLIVKGNESCPTDKPTDPVNGDFVNANTVTHQTSGDTGSVLSFTCRTIACAGADQVVLETSGAVSLPTN